MYHPKHVKVFLWPHKHFMHWSHTTASIYMHIAIITCNKCKVIEITLHMLMLMDAQMMLMLMNASAQCMLNTRVLQAPTPLPRSILKTLIHISHLDHDTPGGLDLELSNVVD